MGCEQSQLLFQIFFLSSNIAFWVTVQTIITYHLSEKKSFLYDYSDHVFLLKWSDPFLSKKNHSIFFFSSHINSDLICIDDMDLCDWTKVICTVVNV